MIYSYNKSQRDELFLTFILIKKSTCFRQIQYPSTGVSTLYTQQQVFVMLITLIAREVRMDLVGFCYKNNKENRENW